MHQARNTLFEWVFGSTERYFLFTFFGVNIFTFAKELMKLIVIFFTHKHSFIFKEPSLYRNLIQSFNIRRKKNRFELLRRDCLIKEIKMGRLTQVKISLRSSNDLKSFF